MSFQQAYPPSLPPPGVGYPGPWIPYNLGSSVSWVESANQTRNTGRTDGRPGHGAASVLAQRHPGSIQSSPPENRCNVPRIQSDNAPPAGASSPCTKNDATPPTQPGEHHSKAKRLRRPANQRWEAEKNRIHRLYITENKTLDETVRLMAEQRDFLATPRMYKDKLGEWGMMKNMKRKVAKQILSEVRKRGDRATEVFLHGKPVPVTRAQKACKGYRNQDSEQVGTSPERVDAAELVIRTPPGAVLMAGDGRSSVSETTHAPGTLSIEQPWTPSGAAFVPGQDSHPFQGDGRGLTITELQKVYAEAADLELATDLREAERKFCVALSGFRRRLGTTHEATTWTALCLTRVHARQAHRRQAAEVANWMFRNLCEKWGLWHTQTMRHYLEVANILMDASRVSSLAVVLGSRMFAASRDGHDPCTPVLLPEDEEILNEQLPDPLEYDVHMRLVLMGVFQKTRDPAEFDLQIQLADLLITCDFPDVDFIPEILVEQCSSDDPPTIPTAQDLRARCFLIRQLIDSLAAQASKECEFARDALQVAVDRSEGQISPELVAASHELAFLHIDIGEARRCERVLSWMAKQLQSAPKSRCQILSTIGFMIRAGIEYRHRSDTSGAATWFESAYGYSSRTLGPRSSTTISLGQVVEKGTYARDHVDAILLRMPLLDIVPVASA